MHTKPNYHQHHSVLHKVPQYPIIKGFKPPVDPTVSKQTKVVFPPRNVKKLLGSPPPPERPRTAWVLLLQEKWPQLGKPIETLPKTDQGSPPHKRLLKVALA